MRHGEVVFGEVGVFLKGEKMKLPGYESYFVERKRWLSERDKFSEKFKNYWDSVNKNKKKRKLIVHFIVD